MSSAAFPQHAESQAIEPLLRQALAHHRAGQLLEAGGLYQAILQARPGHAEANHNLGVIAMQAQRPEAGLPYFEAALDADPTRGQYWLSYIDALHRAGHQEDARAVLSLARQQGLEGPEVDGLTARIDAGSPAAEPQGSATQDAGPPQSEMQALVALFNAGRYDDVVARAWGLTARFPRHPFAWKILSVAFKLLGRAADALAPMRKAAELAPDDVESHYNLGVTLQELGEPEEAEIHYRQALRIDPVYASACLNLGVTLHTLGRLDEAEAILLRAVQITPECAEAHSNLGATLEALGRLDDAEASYRRALQADPDNAVVHNNLGVALLGRGRLDEAADCLRVALELRPDYADAHANLGDALQALERPDEAEASFRRALRSNPNDAKTHNHLAILLQGQGRLEEADTHFQAALSIAPDEARLHDNRGNLLLHMGRLADAEASYRNAREMAPQDPKIMLHLGGLLRQVGRHDESEAIIRQALEVDRSDVALHLNLGLVLKDQGRLDQAETCFRNALEINPDGADAIGNLGQVMLSLGRLDEAEGCFRRAAELAPDCAPLFSNLLYFLTLSANTDPPSVFAEHVRFGARFEAPLRPCWPTHANERDPERCLQVGFVSPDFRNHAVASFIEPVLARLSGHPGLTLHGYCNSFLHDATTERLRAHFAHWHPIAGLSDAELADRILADRVDILIDLTGHTASNRLLTFARKPAPVQASWIGYPGTTGLAAMDYYFADRFLLPPGQFDDQFTEKIVHLVGNAPFMPFEGAPPVNELPALSKGYMTFGSFNRPDKLSHEVIALWSQLLRALPDSRMLLGGMPETGHRDTLIASFEGEGVGRERLDFHPRSSMDNYLALHHRVDMCLDTFPYNGGTTTHHALWMGVPTLTLAGVGARGRVGFQILALVGLEGFAATTAEDFVACGLNWSKNLGGLGQVRRGLREQLQTSPLRRPEIIASGLERALRHAWRRWCEGIPAESFEVHLHEVMETALETDK